MSFKKTNQYVELDKYLIIPIIILAIVMIYKLIDYSKLVAVFPLDYTNDISAYMAILFFLKTCGFHNLCPYWYNGFMTFYLSNPGWYFFVYPLYLLTNNVQLTAYSSIIIEFILIFSVIFYFGKRFRFSLVERLFFFFALFGNAVAVGNFIRLGRVHELFAWLNFIFIGFSILIYKNKRVDFKFLFLIVPLSLSILTHPSVATLTVLTLLPLLLIKDSKERIIISLTLILSLILTSFWWINFLKSFWISWGTEIVLTNTLLVYFFVGNLPTLIVPLIMFTMFYFYWKSHNWDKKELIFFTPLLILATLLLFRVISFIPILKFVYPDNYIYYILFFSIFMFFKTDYKSYLKYKKSILYGLIIISLISAAFSLFYTPNFVEHDKIEKNTLDVLGNVNGSFLILGSEYPTSYTKAYYSYAPIYLNLTTPSGWDVVPTKEHADLLILSEKLIGQDCNGLKDVLKKLKTDEIITYDDHCNFLKGCGFGFKYEKENICLFTV